MESKDPILGKKIDEHLKSLRIHTPTLDSYLTDEEKVKKIANHIYDILNCLGLDLSDDSLKDTPRRIAKMFVYENFYGLKPENFPKCTTIENKMRYDEMIVEKDIKVMSVCEHHFVPIHGKAIVAYIPNKKVIGLSKMNRIVNYFSRRPQVQERLTQQVAEALKYILETESVAVLIKAKHYCIISRGVEDQNSETTTSYLSGVFKNNPIARSEFMSIAASQNI